MILSFLEYIYSQNLIAHYISHIMVTSNLMLLLTQADITQEKNDLSSSLQSPLTETCLTFRQILKCLRSKY